MGEKGNTESRKTEEKKTRKIVPRERIAMLRVGKSGKEVPKSEKLGEKAPRSVYWSVFALAATGAYFWYYFSLFNHLIFL